MPEQYGVKGVLRLNSPHGRKEGITAGAIGNAVPQELIDQLDALTQGKLSRSQLVRLVL